MKTKKYVVSYGIYNGSEHKDALSCGVFRELYDTMESAHAEIMKDIREQVEIYLEDLRDNCGETFPDGEADRIVAAGVWRNMNDSVRFELFDTEYAYEVESVEV